MITIYLSHPDPIGMRFKKEAGIQALARDGPQAPSEPGREEVRLHGAKHWLVYIAGKMHRHSRTLYRYKGTLWLEL